MVSLDREGAGVQDQSWLVGPGSRPFRSSPSGRWHERARFCIPLSVGWTCRRGAIRDRPARSRPAAWFMYWRTCNPAQALASRWRMTSDSPDRRCATSSSSRVISASNVAMYGDIAAVRSMPRVSIATFEPPFTVAHHELGRCADVVEEHFAELESAGDVPDRTDVDAGLVCVDEEHRDPAVPALVDSGR